MNFTGDLVEIHQERLYESEEHLVHLINKAKNGCLESRDSIILSFMGTIKSIAIKYAKYTSSMEFEDIYGYGIEGLVRSINAFSPEKNIKFISYMYATVQRHIERALLKHRHLIRLPYDSNTVYKLARDTYEQGKIEENSIPCFLEYVRDGGEIRELQRDNTFISRESLISKCLLICYGVSSSSESKGSHSLEELEKSSINVENKVLTKIQKQEFIKSVYSFLKQKYNDRDKQIYIDYIINGKTLKEIGKEYDISGERCRQIVERITKKIKKEFKNKAHIFNWEV